MSRHHPTSARSGLAALVCLFALAGTTATAQDIKATVQIETGDQPAMTMAFRATRAWSDRQDTPAAASRRSHPSAWGAGRHG